MCTVNKLPRGDTSASRLNKLDVKKNASMRTCRLTFVSLHYAGNPMKTSEEENKFQFVVSTPDHDASAQEEVQTLVQKHVMRPFRKHKRASRIIILKDEATLADYFAHRQYPPLAAAPAIRNQADVNVDNSDLAGTSLFTISSPSNDAGLLGASHPNPFARYPISMEDKEHELVHHSKPFPFRLSPLKLPSSYIVADAIPNVVWSSRQVVFQPFSDFWFSLGMLDPVVMHLVIANAAMHRKACVAIERTISLL
jgi:hypothetical protein